MEKHKIYNTFKDTYYTLKVRHDRSALLPTAAPAQMEPVKKEIFLIQTFCFHSSSLTYYNHEKMYLKILKWLHAFRPPLNKKNGFWF